MKPYNTVASPSEDTPRSRRLYQIDSLLQHELGALFVKFLEPPLGTLVSISSIIVSHDLEVAEIKLSIIPFAERQKVFLAITGQLKELSRELNRRLRLYRVPKLNFVVDETEERADRLEQLLDSQTKPE